MGAQLFPNHANQESDKRDVGQDGRWLSYILGRVGQEAEGRGSDDEASEDEADGG